MGGDREVTVSFLGALYNAEREQRVSGGVLSGVAERQKPI